MRRKSNEWKFVHNRSLCVLRSIGHCIHALCGLDNVEGPMSAWNLPPGVSLRDIDPDISPLYFDEQEECPACHGSGEDETDQDCKCAECDGKGVV